MAFYKLVIFDWFLVLKWMLTIRLGKPPLFSCHTFLLKRNARFQFLTTALVKIQVCFDVAIFQPVKNCGLFFFRAYCPHFLAQTRGTLATEVENYMLFPKFGNFFQSTLCNVPEVSNVQNAIYVTKRP